MERTLLLSQSYEPIATISWQRAICLLTLGKVEIVEEYDRDVRSVSVVFKMPSVVRLIRAFRRHRKRVKFSKQNVFARDRWRCQYCGTKAPISDLTYDHMLPRSRGGKTCWENIVTACRDCNARKADRTPEEAGMKPRKRPERPNWVPVFSVNVSQNIPDTWRDYCWGMMAG